MNALIAGEIDMIENVPHDLLPLLKADKNVQTVNWNPLGQQFIIRFNHLTKPFDNPKIRQAALLLRCARRTTSRRRSASPQYYKVCTAAFVCGTPNGVEIQGDLLIKPDFEKSKALLKEAGYDGSPVVLMQSTTLPVLTNTAPVTKSLLEQGGFKVDMQSMDWQTVVTRRTKKDPADTGRLERLPHLRHRRRHPQSDLGQLDGRPAATRRGSAGRTIRRWRSCATPTPGRPIPVKNKALAAAVQNRALETAQYGWLGMWYGPGAARDQRRRLAQGAGARAVEHREEVTE